MPDYAVTLRVTIPARTPKEAMHRAHLARQSLLRRDAISHAAMPEMAEALIDPNDPAVRETIVQTLFKLRSTRSDYIIGSGELADAVLAALQSKGGTDAR